MKSKIHRCNCRRTWSIQNRKRKINADSILLSGEWFAEIKPERKCDPKGFVITNESKNIILNPPKELIEQFTKVTTLIYNKGDVDFNIYSGKYLFFAENGACYILKKIM